MNSPLKLVLIATSLVAGWQTTVADEIRPQAIFTEDEIEIIQGYYRKHDVPTKKDHKKHKTLPPGIAKNLERGKPLPPGIAKRYLPADLQEELPVAPEGYERIVIDDKILLIEIATQMIQDVLAEHIIG